jgi:hypothetical protein
MVDFKTHNNKFHYQLTYYPALSEYPPVLWGKLEEADGKVSYLMFRKKADGIKNDYTLKHKSP